jgi:predicted nucleotidyltransferase component of viral defense system
MLSADPVVMSDLQHRMIQVVAATESSYGPPGLRLEGGTALAAYHLRHRESEDLDFFADPGFNAVDFARLVRENAEQAGVRVETIGASSPGFVRLLGRAGDKADSVVKIDLAMSSASRLEPIERTAEGISIASYRDLCAGKLHAICDRFEPRDFVDLHAIVLHGFDRRPPADRDLVRRIGALVDRARLHHAVRDYRARAAHVARPRTNVTSNRISRISEI